MALPTILKGLPNVPSVAGVPPLDRLGDKVALLQPANIFGSAIQKVPYLRGILQTSKSEVWGIFDKKGRQVIIPDTFFESSNNSPSKIARFYVEEGTFANFNKVIDPNETTVILIKTGVYSELNTYIEEIEKLRQSVELYDIITPERTLTDVNLESFDYSRRRTDGVNLIQFNLHFIEIREVALAYSTRTIPVASASQDRGQQQAKKPRVSLLSKLKTAVG